MYQIVWFVAIVILLLAWIGVEMRGRAGARLMLGLAVMVCIGLTWFFTDLRMVQLDAYHQALFRQMDTAMEAGDIETLKRAVSAYNHAEAGELPVFRALDAMKEKKDVVGTTGDGR
jgi:hypothetical protein